MKILKYVGSITLVVAITLTMVYFVFPYETQRVGGSMTFTPVNSHNATSTYLKDGQATNTPSYITATSSWWMNANEALFEGIAGWYATTTQRISVEGVDIVTVMTEVVSTTSVIQLSWDARISPDGKVWYDFIPTPRVDTTLVSPTDAYLLATGTLRTWIGPVDAVSSPTTTPSWTIDLRGTAAKHLEVDVGVGVGTATVRQTLLPKGDL